MRTPPFLALLLLLSLAGFAPASADAEEATWQSDEVARAGKTSITWDDLCRTAVDAAVPDLLDAKSHASLLFEQLVGIHLRTQLAAREGVQVDDGEVAAVVAEHQEEWSRAGWPRRLQLALTVAHFQEMALEQAGLDLRAEREKVELLCAFPTAAAPTPASLPEDVAAKVGDAEIRLLEFGDHLLARAPPQRVQEWIERALKIALADASEKPLDDATLREEFEYLGRLAPLEARFDPAEIWDQFAVRAGAVKREEHTVERMLRSPYARSLFGLVRRLRTECTPAEVRREWERLRDSVYGAHVVATDLEIAFRSAGDVFTPGVTRTRSDALRLARKLRVPLSKGASFDEVAARTDGEGISVRQLRLYATNKNRLLHDLAMSLSDGEVSRPFETLAEVHLLRREALAPAPAFEQIEALVRERLARDRARRYLEDGIADPVTTKRRWPLPQLD